VCKSVRERGTYKYIQYKCYI